MKGTWGISLNVTEKEQSFTLKRNGNVRRTKSRIRTRILFLLRFNPRYKFCQFIIAISIEYAFVCGARQKLVFFTLAR